MPVIVYCKDCGKKIRAPDGPSGRRGKCPRCSATVPIPDQDEDGPPPPDRLQPRWREAAGEDAPAPSTAPKKAAEPPAPEDAPAASLSEDAPTPPEAQEAVKAAPALVAQPPQAPKAPKSSGPEARARPANPGPRIQLTGSKGPAAAAPKASSPKPKAATPASPAPTKPSAQPGASTPAPSKEAPAAEPEASGDAAPAQAKPSPPAAGAAKGKQKIKLGGLSGSPDKDAAAGGIKLDGKVEEVEQGITWDDTPDPPPPKGPMVLAFLIALGVGAAGYGVWWLMQDKPPARMSPQDRKSRQFKVKPQLDEIDRLRMGVKDNKASGGTGEGPAPKPPSPPEDQAPPPEDNGGA